MLDPFFAPPELLSRAVQPIATFFNLTTLPLHIHEVLVAFAFYHFINSVGAPWISRKLFPTIYPTFNTRTKVNWDVHVVSLVQSCLINALALWVMWVDDERATLDWKGRVWGYTGSTGMIQGFAAGYFLWDLCVSVTHVGIFGWGLLAHAVSALAVFSLGFRPFVNFYAPTFILYELSSPFLNFHWFFDKVHMTGSKAQLYNGITLLAVFFCCRLVWGTYQSVRVYQDVWAAIQSPGAHLVAVANDTAAVIPSDDKNLEIMRFSHDGVVPVWLAASYLLSNVVLNTLNFYWFGKMIETVRKRFQPRGKPMTDGVIAAGERIKTEVNQSGAETIIVEQMEIRQRKADGMDGHI